MLQHVPHRDHVQRFGGECGVLESSRSHIGPESIAGMPRKRRSRLNSAGRVSGGRGLNHKRTACRSHIKQVTASHDRLEPTQSDAGVPPPRFVLLYIALATLVPIAATLVERALIGLFAKDKSAHLASGERERRELLAAFGA